MRIAAIQQRLLELAEDHPNAHPFTLALRLQVETGSMISGLQARAWLRVAQEQSKTETQP